MTIETIKVTERSLEDDQEDYLLEFFLHLFSDYSHEFLLITNKF